MHGTTEFDPRVLGQKRVTTTEFDPPPFLRAGFGSRAGRPLNLTHAHFYERVLGQERVTTTEFDPLVTSWLKCARCAFIAICIKENVCIYNSGALLTYRRCVSVVLLAFAHCSSVLATVRKPCRILGRKPRISACEQRTLTEDSQEDPSCVNTMDFHHHNQLSASIQCDRDRCCHH